MEAKYLSHYLTDSDVANFARQSFGKLASEFTAEQNNDLVRFLARGMRSKDWDNLINEMLNLRHATVQDPYNERNRQRAHELAVYMRSIPEHWVPFGHPHISIRMKAPVPIRTQCFKHKIGFVESEESRRYIKSTPELYIPENFRKAADDVKQGSGDTHPDSPWLLDTYKRIGNEAIQAYETMVGMGVCAEQARFILPQGCEVNWVWTGSLYAFANYVNQRTENHAQKESQWLAGDVDKIIAPLFPVSWAALTKGDY